MVLENASESASEGSFDDAPPSSDNDRYEDHREYHIDADKLPRPVPFFGPLWGFTPQMAGKLIEAQMTVCQKTLGRFPTQQEADAFAYIAYKQVSMLSYYPPIGILGGGWRAYQTASTFRFPFYQPNLDTFKPEEFPPRSPILRGSRAVMAWHTLRTVPYVVAGLFFSSMFISSYASTVSSMSVMSDPRLKDIVSAVRERAQQKIESLQKEMGQKRKVGQEQQPNTQQDDSSPTGGMWGSDNGDNTVEAATKSSPTAAPRPWPKVRPVPEEPPAQDSRDQPFDAFDDASPTGGQGMFEDRESSPRQQTGSAWERIRRGEKPAANSGRPAQSAWSKQQDAARESSTTGESFAFSKSVEERAYAQEEAQREFDARVERERRGGDFSQNGGDQKRW